MELATEAAEATEESFSNEDHASFKPEEEVDVTLEPSLLGKDDGVGFKEEDHGDIETEDNVEAHLPDAEADKSEGFTESHAIADTIVDDDYDDEKGHRETDARTTSNKVEFAQEMDLRRGTVKKAEQEKVEEEPVSFVREIKNDDEERVDDEDGWGKEKTVEAVEITLMARPPAAAMSTSSAPAVEEKITSRAIVARKKAVGARDPVDPMMKLQDDLRDLHVLVEDIKGSEKGTPTVE